MKLKNNALQELYDTLVSGNPTISSYAESPFDKAFRECDKKIQKEIENLLSRTHYAEDEVERLRKSHDELFNAGSRKISEVRRENEAVNKKLEKDLTDAKVRLHFLTRSRDDWKRRVEHAEDEVEALKKDNEDLEKRLMETTEALDKVNSDRTELQKDRDSYHELYTELSKDYDKLFEDNKNLKARTDCLRYEVEWYRKHYKEQSDKISELKTELDELTSQYQKLTMENKRLQNNVRAGYDQGQTDLWVKLQDVKDMQPEEFDAECDGMEDVISMDLEDFLDAYKKWQEDKEKERLDHMRDYLARFCSKRFCDGCPLESTEYKCGCGYSFMDTHPIPDEELERYYNRVRQYNSIWHGTEKIKDACDAFAEGLKAGLASEVKEVPVSCDVPIKDLASWESTIEATVEINKDLLEKVCGVKPDEEAHKLEYGDAVRLIWRDYDYMYIGPDEKEGSLVRLFNPKKHAIVTSHIANVRYNGGKIVLTSEKDLRMVWKAKK